jgi:hypothetical protein
MKNIIQNTVDDKDKLICDILDLMLKTIDDAKGDERNASQPPHGPAYYGLCRVQGHINGLKRILKGEVK